MFKAVAWDVDGTLVDSEPLHLRSLLSVCNAYGVNIFDLPDNQFIGVNLYSVWEALRDRFPANLERTNWIAQINRFYAANRSSLAAIPRAAGVVQELHAHGGV